MKKRWTAALLAFILAVSLLPGPARAAAPAGNSAGSRLTGANREVYDYLRGEIIKIAAGDRTSTEIRIPELNSLRWTVEELGADGRKDVLATLQEKLEESLDFGRVYSCLSADLPFEMFWADNSYSWGCSFSRDGNWASARSITVQLHVARDYQGGSENRTSGSRITAANQAAMVAQTIVDRHQGKSDFEKLTAYREEICRLASYNTEAAGGGIPYGDPWQLIYVFDGDPDTNVVCEGYAKAFKYLCDLSEFDGDVVCRIVTGTMGGRDHMWNVVRMGDGKNYLADVTNCDDGAVGADDKLFLAGAAGSEDGRTYTVTRDRFKSVYTYDSTTEGVHTDGCLALSASDYDPGWAPAPAPAAGFSDVDPSAYYADAVAWAVDEKITNGTSETTFSPDKTCTEAEILTFVWRAAGKPDNRYGVTEEGRNFYSAALFWAYDVGMLHPSRFDPNAPCTRLSAVEYLWWDLHFRDPAPDESLYGCFDDVPEDSPHAETVAWAVERGITTGTSSTTFSPNETCTRGQIVTFLYRAYH